MKPELAVIFKTPRVHGQCYSHILFAIIVIALIMQTCIHQPRIESMRPLESRYWGYTGEQEKAPPRGRGRQSCSRSISRQTK